MSDLEYMNKEIKWYCKDKCSRFKKCLEENKTEDVSLEMFEQACQCRYYAENGK